MTVSLIYSSAGESGTVPAPTVSNGDIMIVTLYSDSGAVGGSLSGWTEIDAHTHTSGGVGYQTLYKVAASESGDYNFGSIALPIYTVQTFRDSVGGGTWSVEDFSTSEADSATSTSAAVAVSTADLLYVAYSNDGGRTVSTAPATMTAAGGLLLAARALVSYYEIMSAPDATATRTLVWNSTEQVIAGAAVIRYTVSGGAYSLAADSSSYALNGEDAALSASRRLSADSGSYSYSGTAVDLITGFSLAVDSGSYSYAGTATDLIKGSVLASDSGTYTYSGTAATLTFTSAGSFTLVGESGSYSYSGTIAALTSDRVLVSSSGAYTYSGTAATLSPGFSLAVDSGSYAYTGTAIDFSKTSVLNAVSGNYVYNGSTVSLTYTPIGPDIPTADGLTVSGSFGNGVSFTASFGSGVSVRGKL